MISTPRRRAPINPFVTTTAVCLDRGLSNAYPHTPPITPASSESVVGLGRKATVDKKYDEAYERIKAKSTWTQTLPSSNFSSRGTVRQVSQEKPPPVRADSPRPTVSGQLQLSKLEVWIITELEAAVASIPPVNLSLDSPVILSIRLPAEQRKVPRKTPPTLPLSRYSNFPGPLSSHPTQSSLEVPLQAASLPNLPILPTDLTIRSLRIIFPDASLQILSSLQATYLALHYIPTIRLPSPFHCIETLPPLPPNMSYIPVKARAMLGLQTPTIRPGLPLSWTRPESRGWRERIEDLEWKLRNEVARLVNMCQGSESGKNEALIRAVGQIVRFGQEETSRPK